MSNEFDTLYELLEIEITKFQSVFIPTGLIRPLGIPNPSRRYEDLVTSYTEEIKVKMQAYIVSTHGLFERFLEDVARQILDKSKVFYQKKEKVNKFFVLLIGSGKIEINKVHKQEYLQNTLHLLPNKKSSRANKDKQKNSTDVIINHLAKKFNEYLDNNHNILSNNETGVYDMLCKVGIERPVDMVLYQQLKDFVKERGDFAHQGVVKVISPATAQTYIDNVLLIAKDVTEQAKVLVTTIA